MTLLKPSEKLRQSIIILKRLSYSLSISERGIQYLVEKRDQIPIEQRTKEHPEFLHLHTAMWCNLAFTVINYCSFIDEFNDHFMLPALHSPEVHKALRQAVREPVLQIKKAYGDIKSARNTVFAHGFRKNATPLPNSDIYKGLVSMVNRLEPTNFSLPSITTQQIIQIIEGHYTPATEAEFGF